MMEKKPQKPQTPHCRFGSKVSIFCFFYLVFTLKVVYSQGDDAKAMNDLKKSLKFPKPETWTGNDYCSWGDGVSCSSDGRVNRIQIKNQGVVTGSLPASINQLTSLEHLEFKGTNLTGVLPSLKGLSSLRVILLSENGFTGVLPSDFFEGLVQLQAVSLDFLKLTPGPIPPSLQSCSGLVNFSMGSSYLNGEIPDFFNANTFTSLQHLHMNHGNLSGSLPSNLSTLTTLQTLWLNDQKLSGGIDVLQKMTGLTDVQLNQNKFTGPIPDFSALENLATLDLRDNRLTGLVPESLQTLKSLKLVNLTNNLLQGPTPQFGKSVIVDMIVDTNSFCLDTPGNCSDNVNTLLAVAKDLGYPTRFGEDWKGNNPCQPWLGIACNANGAITGINFQKFGLAGTISGSFSLLKSLERLNLANNSLYGKIPKELTTLPAVKEIDLSNNNLSGDVPSFKNVVVKTDGNPNIGKAVDAPPSPGTPPGGSGSGSGSGGSSPDADDGSKGGKKSKFPVLAVVGGVIGIVVLLLLGLGFCLYKRKRKSGRLPNAMVIHPHHSGSDNDMVKITVAGSNVNVSAASESHSYSSSGPSDVQMVEAGNMVISIQVLRNVTNNFSEDNVLGRGGFGTVYKGELHDGTKIAVKRMESGVMGSKGLTEFKSEIAVLNKVRHRHLVSLIGYCLDGNERILVYEFMPQGTLSQHLFSWQEEGLKPLSWTRRLSIALDVARGVEYLHGLASQSFIHRDLKPSNILLGDDMRAKVADFGLVRLAPEGKASIETRLAGTFGYLAPEYAATGRVTTKVDIYAFGVILMELITGRKALDESQPEESMHLVTWFRRMNINEHTALKAIDPNIDADEEALVSITKVGELAGYCCSREPHQRPDMGHVVNVLSSYVERWKPSDTDPEDIYAIDMDLSLAQTLKKWQAFDGDSMGRNTSSYIASSDNTQTSIPTRPPGFAESFTSADGR